MAKLQRRMRRAFTPELETEAAGLWPVDPELEALERKLRRGSQAEAAHKAGRWPRSELAPSRTVGRSRSRSSRLSRKLRRGSQAEAAHKAGRWPRSELAPMSRGMKISLVIALLIIGAGLPIMVHVLRTLAGGFRYMPGQ